MLEANDKRHMLVRESSSCGVSWLHQQIQMLEVLKWLLLDQSCYLRMGLVVTGCVVVVGDIVVVGNFFGRNL